MAAPILTTMMSNVRLLIADTSTTAPAFTDAQVTTFINLALMWWYENYEKRVKYVTLVADWDTQTEKDGDATCIYPEILEVMLKNGAASTTVPLRPMGWSELRNRQTDGTVADGTPAYHAKLKYGGAGVGAAAQNLWKFALLPTPTASNNVLLGIVRDYPVALSAGADIVDLGDFEAKCVEVIAAIFAAHRAGRPELAEDLRGLLPQLVQDKLETHRVHDEATA
jgi:hypothetical protein